MVYWNNIIYGAVLWHASCTCAPFVSRSELLTRGQIVTRVLLDKSNYTDSVASSPYFAGIITASMIWVTYTWLRRLLPCKCPHLTLCLALTQGSHRHAVSCVHASYAGDRDRLVRLQLLPRHYPRPRNMSEALQRRRTENRAFLSVLSEATDD